MQSDRYRAITQSQDASESTFSMVGASESISNICNHLASLNLLLGFDLGNVCRDCINITSETVKHDWEKDTED